MKESKLEKEQQHGDQNRDPISGAPGAHPVGTGVGAASGGAAGAAIGTAVGGPIGAGIGILAGAVIGGLAGKGAAEAIDPTAEDAYWQENYSTRQYVGKDTTYETYRPAYRIGYEGYGRYKGSRYEEVESELQREYERSVGRTGLRWERARHAARDAWDRLEKPAPAAKQPGVTRPAATRDPEGSRNKPTEPSCGCS